MPEETTDVRILREIRERLKKSRAAVEEYERLQAALHALDATNGAPAGTKRGRGGGTSKGRARAPRGANRDKVIAAIRDRTGITVGELALVTGISKNALYGVTRNLVEAKTLERVELPGGTTGFRVAETSSNEPASSADTPEEGEAVTAD
jgi:hypothetical protein